MAPNGDLEALAAARKAEREEKEQRRLERKAARLAQKGGGEAGAAAAEAAAPAALAAPLSKLEKKQAIKVAKQRRKEAKAAEIKAATEAAVAAKAKKKAQRNPSWKGPPGADGGSAPTQVIGKKRGLGAKAKQLDRDREQKRFKKGRGGLVKSGKYDYGNMTGGKITKAELAELAGEEVHPVGHDKKLIGFTLGWTRTNGGFGSKADTMARKGREDGTVGMARAMGGD